MGAERLKGVQVPLPVVIVLVALAAGAGILLVSRSSGDGGKEAVPSSETVSGRSNGVRIVGAFVTGSAGGGSSVRPRYFAPGRKTLYCYVKYSGAGERHALDVVWSGDGEVFGRNRVSLEKTEGEFLDSCDHDFGEGRYEVRLYSGDLLRGSVSFRVAAPPAVRIVRSSVAPDVVFPGDEVTAIVEYAVEGPQDGDGLSVTEKRLVRREGLTVSEPGVRELVVESGANSSSARVRLPSSALPGEYELITVVQSNGAEDRIVETFRVRRRSVPVPDPSGGRTESPSSKGEKSVTIDQLDRLLKGIYRNR